MHQKNIQTSPNWRNEGPQNDCKFVITNLKSNAHGFAGIDVACVLCFLLFLFQGELYPYAIVQWFDHVDDRPDKATWMWIVQSSSTPHQQSNIAVLQEMKLKVTNMPCDMLTWWNSIFDMLEYVLNHHDVVDAVTQDYVLELRKYELDDGKWALLEHVLKVSACYHMFVAVW